MKITPIFPIVILSLAPIAPAAAQLTPDNTLGRENSHLTPVNPTTDRIDAGAARGSNLFHSFSDFNVDTGRSVYFANPPAIENILTRVTGSNPSNIMGRLGVLGDANLFLINPNGIVFGPEASLDIRGSFYGTTGEGIKLGENGLFSATDLDPSKLLQVQPSALFQNALANHMAELNNQANLAVGTGSQLVLHGGEVRNSGSLTAPGGTVMVLGERVGLFDNASIDVSEATGGGEVLVTGARTYVGPDVTIKADALSTGNGGNVIVWADEVTGFYGNISARGGIDRGNGGLVEVSGGESLIYRGDVDTSAADGDPGMLLLDPRNITIANGSPLMEIEDADSIASDIFNGAVDDTEEVTIYESQLEGLSGDTNVVLQATNDIVVEDLADDELSFAPGTGEITFTADADGDGIGSFVMLDAEIDVDNGPDTIVTNGRDIAISAATLTIGNIDARRNSVVPPDNAGQSLSTAQVISSGSGVALETIEGTLATADDVDIFGIYLSGSGTFSATVDSRVTELSLFDADGRGIYRQGAWPSGGLVPETPLTPSERGIYYLAVGNTEPVSEGGSIFANPFEGEPPYPEVVGASGPGGALPLRGWEGNGSFIGSYTISLTGTQAGDTTFVESPAEINENGGRVRLEATHGDLKAGNLSSSPSLQWSNAGFGGAISLTAGENITTGRIESGSGSQQGAGNGGAISLTAGGDITTGGIGSASSSIEGTAGNGGEIFLTAGGDITTGAIRSGSGSQQGAGNGGAISLTAGGDITTVAIGSGSGSINETAGNGGAISLRAGGDIATGGIGSGSNSPTASNGGEISLRAGGDIATEEISSSSSSLSIGGNGGAISLRAGGDIATDRILSDSSSLGTAGNGEAISLTAGGDITTEAIGSFSFSGGEGESNGGEISLTAGGDITTDFEIESYSLALRGTAGNGGAIVLEALGAIAIGEQAIGLLNSAFLEIDSSGNSGGQITITSQEKVSLNNVLLSSNANGRGNSGRIEIAADSVNMENTDVNTSALGNAGVGGNIAIRTSRAVEFDRSRLFSGVEPGGTGDGGNISITAGSVDLRNASLIDTATFSQGKAGDVLLEAGALALDNSNIFSITAGEGNGGNVTVNILDTLTLTSSSNISTAVSRTAVRRTDISNGGQIEIEARSLAMTGGSQLQALTRGRGASGNITINVTEDISLSGIGADGLVSGVFTSTEGENSLTGGIIKVTSTNGNVILEDGAVLSAETSTRSAGGSINVDANRMILRNGGQLLTNSSGDGKAGNITVNIAEDVLVTGVDPNFSRRPTPRTPPRQNVGIRPSRTLSEEEARDLKDEAFSLDSLEDNNRNVEFSTRIPYVSIAATGDDTVDVYSFEVTAGTRGVFDIDEGYTGGFLSSDIDTTISLFKAQETEPLGRNDNARFDLGGEGTGLSFGFGSVPDPVTIFDSQDSYLKYAFSEPGTYFIEVGQQSIDENFNPISTGIPAGATYTLQVSLETPNVTGSAVETTANSGMFARASGAGAAGNITVNTALLRIADGAEISATTAQTATTSEPGGSIAINADRLLLSRTGALGSIEAQTLSTSPAGEITLQPLGNGPTVEVNLENGFEISASTAAEGAGGNLNLEAPDSIILTGKGSLSVESLGSGPGGNATITTDSLRLREGATVSASSTGMGEAGSVNVEADFIELDNGFVEAETAAGARGNINISTSDLRLFNDSAITTNATGTATGGNITIDTDNMVLKKGTSISANAVEGAGGNIQITAQGVFAENENQITATSDRGIDGIVEINSETERASGVVELDNNPIDAEKILAQNFCVLAKDSSFTIVGRGGIAQNHTDQLQSPLTWQDFRLAPESDRVAVNNNAINVNSQEIVPDEIRQAQGWVQLSNGTVVLTSYPVIPTPHGPLLQHPDCNGQ